MSIEDAIAKAAAAQAQVGAVIPPRTWGRIVHIDGDYLAYWVAAISEEPGRARQVIHETVNNFKTFSGSVGAVMHLTMPSSNKGERFTIATVKPYQAQRSGTKPAMWEWVREYLTNYDGVAFRVDRYTDREADDGIAYAAGRGTSDLVVIATRDKDMRMLPGWHLDWQTYEMRFVEDGAFDVVMNDLQYGTKWFWLQMLQGDSADNIPGLPKFKQDGTLKLCGEVTARKLLAQAKNDADAYATVLWLYLTYYDEEAWHMLAEQAMLLWLRRDTGANLDDFLQVCPEDPNLFSAVDDITNKVLEINAKANSYRNLADQGSTLPA